MKKPRARLVRRVPNSTPANRQGRARGFSKKGRARGKTRRGRPAKAPVRAPIARPPHLFGTGSHSRLPPRGIWGGVLRSSLAPLNHRFIAPKKIRGKKRRAKWTRWHEARTRVRVYAIVVVFKDEYEDESKPDRLEIDTVLLGASMTLDEARALTRERIFARVTHPGSHPLDVLSLVAGRSFAEILAEDARRTKPRGGSWFHAAGEKKRRNWWTVKTQEGESDVDRQESARASFRRVRKARRRSKAKRRHR